MEKLLAVLALFRKGNAVADPKLWKEGGVTAAMLIPVFLALSRVAESFGYPLPISEADAATVASGLLVVVHVVLTFITSDKVGLPAKPATDADSTGARDTPGS